MMVAPSITVVQQPASVVSMFPAPRPAEGDRSPIYLMFLLNKDEQTVDAQVYLPSASRADLPLSVARIREALLTL